MNQFEVLANEEPGFNESELFHFQSLVADAKIALQDEYTQLEPSNYPANVSLLAVSSKFGYYLAGTIQGFVYGSTETLRNATRELEKGAVGKVQDKVEITVPSPVQHLRLTADETQVVVDAGAGEILIYNVKDIVEQGATARPVKAFQLVGRVIDIRPNPETLPQLAAVLLDGGRCQIIDLTTGETATSIEGDDVTAICWSRKGKQLVCGRKSGKLQAYTASGTLKASIDPPDAMKAGSGDETQSRYVLGVHWIDTHIFFTVYARPRKSSEDDHIHDAYIVDRKAESTTGIKYTKLEEVTPVFGMDEREAHMYIEGIRDFSTDMKNAIIVAHSAATDISVVGQDGNGDWQVWALPENGLAGLPLSEETNMDTFPVGLALDFSTKEDLPPFDEATSSERVKPMPVLMYLNDEDQIGAYYCYNSGIASRGESYAGMIQARDVREAEYASSTPSVEAQLSQKQQEQRQSNSGPFGGLGSAPAADTGQSPSFARSPFGTAVAQPVNEDSFAALLSGESTAPSTQPIGGANSSVGAGGFGSFRNLSLNHSAKSPTNNLSMFNGGGITPNFGSSSFGATGFGGVPNSASTTTSSFADLAKAAQKSKTPITAFEGSVSASSSNVPAFGISSFGATPEIPKSNQSLASLANPAQEQQQHQPLSMTPGAFGAAKTSFAFGKTPPSTATTSSWNRSLTLSATTFGAKTEPEDVKPNALEVAVEPPRSEKSASNEIPIKAELAEETVPKENKISEPVLNAEQPPLNNDLSPSSTMAALTVESTSSAGIELGDLSKSLNDVKSPKETPAQLGKTPSMASDFGSSEQPPHIGSKLSFADLGKATQSLPKISEFGPGTSHFGSSSPALTPTFGKSSFGSATTTVLGITSPGLTNPAPARASAAAPSLSKPAMLTLNGGEQAGKDIEKPAPPLIGQPNTSKLMSTAPSPSNPTTSLDPGSKPTLPRMGSSAVTTSPLKEHTLAGTPVPKPETPTLARSISKPSVEETMATEFESLYFMMNESLRKLDGKQEDLKRKVDAYRNQSPIGKSFHDLDHENYWRVGDVQALSVIADQVTTRAQGLRPKIIQIQQSLGYFDEDTMKLRAKDATIAELLKSEPDAKIKKELSDRELDEEALMKWKQLKLRSERCGDQLDILESKLQDYKKNLRAPVRSKNSSDEGFYSLYGLYVQLREIDKELKIKKDTVKDLEDRFAYAHFKAIHDQARHSALGISLHNDEDEEDEETSEDTEGIRTEGPWPDPLVESTARRLRREQFLDRIWQIQSQRAS